MSARITRPAKPPARPHKPGFPIRKPALVKAADAAVAPINTGKVRAVYTNHGWLMWGIMGLCAVTGVLFRDAIAAGVGYVILEDHERRLGMIGADICTRPLMTIPEYTCTAGELDCFTVAQEAVIRRYQEQAEAHNLWQAEACIPLMP
jgi:hypothetical protein